MRAFNRLAAGLIGFAACGSAALACSPAPPARTPVEIRELAKRSYAAADAVVDASVDMAANTDPALMGAMPLAVLKPIKVWKGNVSELFGVIELSSCDTLFDRKGSRYRILVSRVNDSLFTVDMAVNGLSASDQNAFDQEIDRLVGDQRPNDFSRVGWSNAADVKPWQDREIVGARSPFEDRRILLADLASGSSCCSNFVHCNFASSQSHGATHSNEMTNPAQTAARFRRPSHGHRGCTADIAAG